MVSCFSTSVQIVNVDVWDCLLSLVFIYVFICAYTTSNRCFALNKDCPSFHCIYYNDNKDILFYSIQILDCSHSFHMSVQALK